MIAAGNTNGEVSIFQIQKELPSELVNYELAASLITSNPIERYTIKDAYRSAITCVEWSKNGMKLFSGDSHGIVVQTELDFSDHICKSIEVINEKFAIVQMQFSSPWLLVSSLYRAIVCKQDESKQWKVSQIGRTDRKVLNDFGAVFTPIDIDHRKPPSIICARPGFRFWLADVDGNVSHTFLLKDSINEESIYDVPLLNPMHTKPINIKDTYFGPCFYYLRKYIVTYCESTIFIVNLDKLKVMATIKRLRNIQYLTVNGNEIFIIEGGRSIVRISIVPESGSANAGKTQYVPLLNGNLIDQNIEVQEEKITQADECFELPPIENIQLDIPIACQIGDHNLLKQDKLLLEHSRKLEVFEKINTLDYDESILFRVGTKKKKKTSVHSASSDEAKIDGVVEIGRQAEFFDHKKTNGAAMASNDIPKETEPEISNDDYLQNAPFAEFMTKPCLMQASFCDGVYSFQDTIGVNNQLNLENYESNSIENGVEPVIENAHQTIPHEIRPRKFKPLDFSYPIYPISSQLTNVIQMNGIAKEIPTENSPVDVSPTVEDSIFKEIPLTSDADDHDDEVDANACLNAIKQCAKNHSPIDIMPPKTVQSTVDPTNFKHFTNIANLPKLWDIKIEKCDGNQYNATSPPQISSGNSTREGSDSEWVFL